MRPQQHSKAPSHCVSIRQPQSFSNQIEISHELHLLPPHALAGTTGLLRWHSHSINVGTANMPIMQELQNAANVDKLPAEEFEDRSLIFSGKVKH